MEDYNISMHNSRFKNFPTDAIKFGLVVIILCMVYSAVLDRVRYVALKVLGYNMYVLGKENQRIYGKQVNMIKIGNVWYIVKQRN